VESHPLFWCKLRGNCTNGSFYWLIFHQEVSFGLWICGCQSFVRESFSWTRNVMGNFHGFICRYERTPVDEAISKGDNSLVEYISRSVPIPEQPEGTQDSTDMDESWHCKISLLNEWRQFHQDLCWILTLTVILAWNFLSEQHTIVHNICHLFALKLGKAPTSFMAGFATGSGQLEAWFC
jgi:hypothetical protein